jgi:hypothetical protein
MCLDSGYHCPECRLGSRFLLQVTGLLFIIGFSENHNVSKGTSKLFSILEKLWQRSGINLSEYLNGLTGDTDVHFQFRIALAATVIFPESQTSKTATPHVRSSANFAGLAKSTTIHFSSNFPNTSQTLTFPLSTINTELVPA